MPRSRHVVASPARSGRKSVNPAPAPATVPASGVSYNIVYEELVNDDKDIVGQLAYCLYKQSKQQYLREFQLKNHRIPTEAELSNHVHCAELPSLSLYRDKATREFAEVLSQAAAEKQDELEKHFKARLWQFINRHQPESFAERSWFKLKALFFSGLGGVLGNLLTTLLVLLFLFWAASSVTRDDFTKSAKESFVSGMAEIMGVKVTISQVEQPD